MNMIKDGEIDEAVVMDHIDSYISDPGWKTTFKKVFQQCQHNITEEWPKIEKELAKPPCLINKQVCDGRFMEIVSCMDILLFIVSCSI